MSPEASDLLKRALALPADERAASANTLLDTLETSTESGALQESVEDALDAEVARRIAGRAYWR
jgi:hypothetical protein